MRTERCKYDKSVEKVYYYRDDLEKLSTYELVGIMRSYAITRSRIAKEWDEEESSMDDGRMTEFAYDDNHEYYAVPWVVRDILSKRPHIAKSKRERRRIRQDEARLKVRIRTNLKNA